MLRVSVHRATAFSKGHTHAQLTFRNRKCPGAVSEARRVAVFSQSAEKPIVSFDVQSRPISVEAFEPFGQYIEPIDDMKAFDNMDAQLNLRNGTPRFYIMRLPLKPGGLSFTQITHHKEVTQCLGSLTPDSWYMAVARPGLQELSPEDLYIFKVPFGSFIKLHAGTWHAGPHFDDHEHMDFYNLELADTNQVDHFNFYFDRSLGVRINILPC